MAEKRSVGKKKYKKPEVRTDRVLEALGATCTGRLGNDRESRFRKHIGSCKIGKS